MAQSEVTKADGSVDWSQGVNSIKTPTVASPHNPNGLSRNALAWLNNGTVRDGGVTQRAGWKEKGRMRDGSAIFQGSFMYQPILGTPYPIVCIGGHVYKADPETGKLTDLSLTAFVPNPLPPVGVYLKNSNVPGGTTLLLSPSSEAVTKFGLPGSIVAPNVGSTQFYQTAFPYTGTIPVTVNIAQSFQVVSSTGCGCGFGGSCGFQITLKNLTAVPGTLVTMQPIEGWGDPSFASANFTTPAIGSNVTFSISSTNIGLCIRSGLPNGVSLLSPGPPNPTPKPGAVLNFNLFSFQLVNAVTPTLKNDPGLHPVDGTYFYFCQAEEFLVIQAGDLKTLPLFWDGTVLRRSKGITDTAVASGAPGVNEIPSAKMMDYYMGRLWYAIGRIVSAGDIVKGSSGTGQYNFRDAVLNVTENPLIAGGDGFAVPDSNGDITAVFHNANIDTSTGQGRLFVSTLRPIYALQVPVTRQDWTSVTSANQPLMTVVKLANGSVNDRSIVNVNEDCFFQSLEPGICSLVTATRFFQQWGNIPFSANIQRIWNFTDRTLLSFTSGIYFNNRMLETALPRQLTQGVVHDALIPLDFMPISTFEEQKPPNWEGSFQGIQTMQLLVGNFNGKERAFAIALSTVDSSFNLWEITSDEKFDNVDNRVKWFMEFPALNWGDEFALKKLVAFELWIDRLVGEVVFKVEWRVDGDPCWQFWHEWKQCSARNSCEDFNNPVCYPLVPFQESFRATMVGPRPPAKCDSITGRPAYLGYQFQVRLTILGFCRLRGFLLHAEDVERKLYNQLVC